MLIRSQDKKSIYNLEKMEGVWIATSNEILISLADADYIIGRYSTKEQALEVLDAIEKEYLRILSSFNAGCFNPPKVFHMPEDKRL